MHSGQGLTPENSMRTPALALNAQSRQKLSLTHGDAGVLYIDESSQLQGELNNAAALRTTYSRKAKYNLNDKIYSHPLERFGRIAFLIYSQEGETSKFLSAQHRNPGESCWMQISRLLLEAHLKLLLSPPRRTRATNPSSRKVNSKPVENRFKVGSKAGPIDSKCEICRSRSKPCI